VNPGRSEHIAAVSLVTAGLIVAAVLAPKNRFFLANFAWYWLPHAAVLGLLVLLKVRPAVVAGCALVLAAFLAGYGAWIFTRPQPEPLAWLGYLFSIPGAAIGALAAAVASKYRPALTALAAGGIGLALTSIGLAINQGVVCSTVMYCGF
jgi:hypothetical protein